jgi:hypothetical protein
VGEPTAQLLAALAVQSFFAAVALAGARMLGGALPGGLGLRRPRLGARGLALLVAGFACASHALSLLLAALSLRDTGTLAEIDRAAAAARGPVLLLAFASLALAPALGEELLFRGLLLRAALPRLGARWAIVLSAAAFGLVHLDPVQSPAAFALGIYLGAAALAAASLWAPVLCHGANNALSLLAARFAPELEAPGPLALLGLCGALGAASLGLLAAAARGRDRRGYPPGIA